MIILAGFASGLCATKFPCDRAHTAPTATAFPCPLKGQYQPGRPTSSTTKPPAKLWNAMGCKSNSGSTTRPTHDEGGLPWATAMAPQQIKRMFISEAVMEQVTPKRTFTQHALLNASRSESGAAKDHSRIRGPCLWSCFVCRVFFCLRPSAFPASRLETRIT